MTATLTTSPMQRRLLAALASATEPQWFAFETVRGQNVMRALCLRGLVTVGEGGYTITEDGRDALDTRVHA